MTEDKSERHNRLLLEIGPKILGRVVEGEHTTTDLEEAMWLLQSIVASVVVTLVERDGRISPEDLNAALALLITGVVQRLKALPKERTANGD